MEQQHIRYIATSFGDYKSLVEYLADLTDIEASLIPDKFTVIVSTSNEANLNSIAEYINRAPIACETSVIDADEAGTDTIRDIIDSVKEERAHLCERIAEAKKEAESAKYMKEVYKKDSESLDRVKKQVSAIKVLLDAIVAEE